MSAIDAALRALNAAIARDPDNAALIAARDRLLRERGDEARQLRDAIERIEAAMQVPGLSAEKAAALLAEYQRLTAKT